MMTLVASARAQDFYEKRLRAGQEAYSQKNLLQAVDELRIAAFGFMNTPTLLSETLVRLALAQSAAGKPAEAEATLSRFVDVEKRFATYPKLKLEPEIRAEFQSLLLRRLSPETVRALPSLAGLVETEEQKFAKLPARDRRKALVAESRREPGNPAWPLALAREAAQRQDHKEVLEWTGKALQLSRGSAEALALRAHARAARGECEGALADLKALPPAELDARAELRADGFVCLVESGDWTGAESTLKLVPADLMRRGDVARASQRLAAESQRRTNQTGSVSTAAKSPRKNPQDLSGRVEAPAASAGSPVPPAPSPARGKGDASEQSASNSMNALAESRRLIKALKANEAEKILLAALRSDPDNRQLRLALLEASCLAGAWTRGAQQLPLVSPFAEEEAGPMFYASVVLYETGRTDEARAYMERALPKVSGPLVDEYAKKILGRS